MSATKAVAIHKIGLVTAVGNNAASSCAAFRAKVNNPQPTRFMDGTGEWCLAHGVNLPGTPLKGADKLAAMALTAIREVLEGVPAEACAAMPLLLCVAEKERPGRIDGQDERLLAHIQASLGLHFSPDSCVVSQGRVGLPVAMALARKLLDAARADRVLIVAVDSLLNWASLSHYDQQGRLLTQANSNGFMAGEGAGALLVGRPSGQPELCCTGMGFAMEQAHIDSEEPLRAEGLSAAIKDALHEAGLTMSQMDFRMADLSGEQYYFKEAALALARTLHQPKPEFDLWHPAECTGEAGALAGAAMVAWADVAMRKGYARGPNVMAHMANDTGPRAVLVLQYRGA